MWKCCLSFLCSLCLPLLCSWAVLRLLMNFYVREKEKTERKERSGEKKFNLTQTRVDHWMRWIWELENYLYSNYTKTFFNLLKYIFTSPFKIWMITFNVQKMCLKSKLLRIKGKCKYCHCNWHFNKKKTLQM
jgi:hypothetical protein